VESVAINHADIRENAVVSLKELDGYIFLDLTIR